MNMRCTTQPVDPDMALLFLGSWLATLHDAPKRDDAKLDALAWHILGERSKTLLGLAITACAEKRPSPTSVDSRLRQPLTRRTGCLRCHRKCDAYPRRVFDNKGLIAGWRGVIHRR
jgi:hypothetical protein